MTQQPPAPSGWDPNRAAQVVAQMLAAMGDFPLAPESDAFSGGLPGASTSVGQTQTVTGLPSNFDQFLGKTSAPTQPQATAGQDSAAKVVQGEFPVTQAFGQGGEGGIDLGTPPGTPVYAAWDGTVQFAGPDPGFGHMVIIDHGNGIKTVYGHLQGDFQVKTGDHVSAGQQLDTVGAGIQGHSSGPHLEWQVQVNGQKVDPAPYLAGAHPIIGSASGNPAPGLSDVVVQKAMTPAQITGAQLANVVQAAAGQTPTHSVLAHDITEPGQAGTGEGSTVKGSMTGKDGDPNAVDAFLAATRQHESGGNYTIYNQSGQSDASGAYQFLSSTWKSMGGSTAAAAQASPAEQDAIARKMAMQLFERYGSWRLVAIAWYGGPGVADVAARGGNPGSPSGQGPYLAYGDTIANMMAGG